MIDWDDFAAGAAEAIWEDSYISEVEEQDLEDELGPGPGGAWDDVIPGPTDDASESVDRDAQAFAQAFQAQVTDDHQDDIGEEIDDDERAGWLAAMQAMGHGTGLFDHGLRIPVPALEPSPEVRNAAQEAVQDQIEEEE